MPRYLISDAMEGVFVLERMLFRFASAAFCRLQPELRRDYPPNLSILFSGGKETKQDSLSNGE